MHSLDHPGPGNDGPTELVADFTQTITDKVIEGWIRFVGKRYGEVLTLHAGKRLALMYSYTVSEQQWGAWYQIDQRFDGHRSIWSSWSNTKPEFGIGTDLSGASATPRSSNDQRRGLRS